MAPVDDRHAAMPAFVDTSSGTRLLKLAGLSSFARLHEHFDAVNLIPFPLPTPQWSAALARCYATSVVDRLVVGGHDQVVLLGGAVAAAFDLPYRPFYEWRWRRTPPGARAVNMAGGRWAWRTAVMPHPSGTVLHWNDPPARDEARAFLAAVGGYEPEVPPWR
jgi:hypothetical protein